MKKFRKMIPMAVLALAVAGAITTQAMNKSRNLTSIQGYIRLNPLGTVCEASIGCTDVSGPLCVVGATQIWGKDFSGKCIVRLYRNDFK